MFLKKKKSKDYLTKLPNSLMFDRNSRHINLVSFILLVFFSFFTIGQSGILRENANKSISQTFEEEILAQRLAQINAELADNSFEYLLTGRSEFKEDFNKFSTKFDSEIKFLKKNIENSDEQRLLLNIEREFFKYLAIQKKIFIERQKASNAEASKFFSIKSKLAHESLEKALAELHDFWAYQLRTDIQKESETMSRWNQGLIVLFFTSIIIIVFLRYFLIRALKKNQELAALQKEVENKIKINEERLLQAVSISHMGFFDHDQISGEMFSSKELKEIYGGKDRKITTLSEFFNSIHPDDKPRIIAAVQHSHDPKGDGKFNVEHRIVLSDGAIRWIRTRAQTFFKDSGKGLRPVRTFGTSIDLTEHKQLEGSLEEAKKYAENADRSKSRFLANMSHEIRTPMNVILGFVNLLLDKNLDQYTYKDYLRRIKKNGELLIYLIDDILDLSKNEASELKVVKTQFFITPVMQDIMQTFEQVARKNETEICIQLLQPIPETIISDQNRLKQIFVNLIGNAIKFSDKKPITIRIGFFEHYGVNNAASLFFDIEDKGIGISPENQLKLFQPFVQADSSVKRKYGGTGLGLALSKRIAKSLGGDLILKGSTPGAGSCFEFSIETGDVRNVKRLNSLKLDPTPALPDELLKSKEAHLQGKKILVVEDSEDNEELMSLYLKNEGVNFDVAHNGIEAIEKANKSFYDVILMDIQMPDLDGLEATKRLRAQGYSRPIVALSAYALTEERERSIQAGCNSHLVKPINQEDLIKEIQRQLDQAAKI